MERKKTKQGILIGFLIFVAVIIWMKILLYDRQEKYPLEFHKEYLNGTVNKATHSRFQMKIRLTNGSIVKISKADNYNYSPPELHKFISSGDSISKPKDCDTLYVFRENRRYFFIPGIRNLNYNNSND